MIRKKILLLSSFAMLAAACGHTVLVTTAAENPAANRAALEREAQQQKKHTGGTLSKGGSGTVNVGAKAPGAATGGTNDATGGGGGESKCATNSDSASGFTADSLTLGTIIPLTGALRPLGEQTVNVMKVAIETTLNRATHIPGPYAKIDWGCPTRDGVFGRHVSLKVFSLQNNTPEEALAGMRRLIDVDHVFLVRDCYLQSNLMGPAVAYQNSKGVPGVWCFQAGTEPGLATWNFSPGTNPLIEAAIHAAYLIKILHKTQLAILTDPSVMNSSVKVIQRVAQYLHHPIPNGCIVQKKAQEAANGEQSEVAKLRTCYGAGGQPDAVMVSDALNMTFGALEAKDQGWAPGTSQGAQWDGFTSQWVTSLAEICQDACRGALTDCQALPCIPWASPVKFPAVKALNDTYNRYLRSYPPDILTYGPQAITGGLGLWLGQTGPDLSREALRETFLSLHNWDAGIGPLLTITNEDHFGGAGIWLIHFTGRSNDPFFADTTGRFITLTELGIPLSLTRV